MLALQAEEDETCSGCGHPMAESMRPSNERLYDANLTTCFACAAIERARERQGEPGLRISVMKNGGAS